MSDNPRLMLLILAALFMMSGVSALIYQVLWMRMLSLVFGVTVYAASTVLACFMGGLALGSFAAGRVADRVRRPLLWFGAAEILIAITVLATPLLLDAVAAVYVPLAADAPAPARNALRILGCAIVLLPPTVLMGATLPLVLRSSLVDTAGIGARVSLLYGVNTAGAIAGALLAGYVLIGSAGVTASFRLAASLNVIVGLAAILYARRLAPVDPTTPAARVAAHEDSATLPRGERRIIPFVFAASGLTALALEVIWFRSLVLYYAATTYAFTTMLATVLAGIAIGSLAVSPLLKRREPTLVLFGALHAAIGIVAVAGAAWLAAIYDPASPSLVQGALALQLPAALLMGAAFPVGCRLWLRSTGEAGRGLGVLYSVNLVGSIAGSLGAGFLLLPRLGSANSLAAVAGLGTLTGITVLLVAARRRTIASLALVVVAIGAFATAYHDLPDPIAAGLARRYRDAGRIFMKDEGVQTTVTVHVRELGGRQLYLDGLHQASDGQDVVLLHRQIGHLPVLLHPNPTRALVIGLGGGATAGAVSLHPSLAVDIVELAPGVVKAADWFTHINEDVLRRPNVSIRIDDARNTLLLRRGRYDVIAADIIQPTHAGAGLLYSQEYFELARGALNDDGVMVQWVGPRSELYYKLIARTFQRVFPETTVWADGTLLVGSMKPLRIDAEAWRPRFAEPALRRALAAADLGTPEALLAYYTAGPDALRAYLGDGPVLSDDRPLLEYYRSLPREQRSIDLDALRGR